MPRLERAGGKMFNFLSPNTWTTISLVLAIVGFVVVSTGHFLLGAVLFLLSSLCDLIDGMVARTSNRATSLGAFWDGIVDRFVDALIILCFIYLEFPRPSEHMGVLITLLLFTTIMPPFIVAYANHRGAVPDPTEKVVWRFAFRIEYLVLFLLIIVVNPLSPGLSYYLVWAGLVLMSATVGQSILLVFIKSRQYT